MNVRETGSVLDGKYEIVDRLGTGGMGEVYLVRHLHLQELRVIKILRQDMAADPSAQKRFMREARLATQIKHPNVAILYDFSRLDDGSFYMVWEHIQGEEVGDRVRRLGPFPVPVAIQLGIQALRGLEVIHGAGIIHRDLSPDNLMIMEDKRGQPTLKIIDLGLARTLETETDARFEITQVGMFMGKLQYCSPEQAGSVGNQPLDARSDLYSFALVLYEMITGMAPFDSENQAGFIFKRLAEDPLPLTGRNPYVNVPPGLDRAVRKALERDREKRYPDTGTFIQELERLLQGMTAAETREIPIASFPPEARPSAPPRPRSTSTDLSKAEKDDLLAQIERAARRVQENASEMARIEQALGAGNVEEAARLIAQVEASNPRTAGLDRARVRLTEMKQTQESESQHKRVTETEQVLAQYLQRKQLPLARLALSTLVELSPSHPKRSEYEGWIEMLGKELEQSKRADAALAAGRAALAGRDFAAARRELENVARDDPSGKRAEAFADEVERAEREAGQDAEVERRMRDLEKALAEQRIADAGRLVDELSRFDVPRVTLDFYRERVQEFRSADQLQEKVNSIEWLYRKHVDDKDWFRAREAAGELAQAFPSSPRTAQMYSEIERLETAHRRELAVEQGVRQVETFIEQGQAAKAELALKILVQMDPDNRHRKRLERQVRALPK